MSQYEKMDGFQFFISNNRPVLIVTFVGDMDQSTIETMTACRNELATLSEAKIIIFNFRDVGTVNGEVIAVLTQIQLDLRNKGAGLRISSLRPPVRDKLLKMGVIRSNELANNLKEALLSLLKESKLLQKTAA